MPDGVSNPAGFSFDVAAGSEVALLPRVTMVIDAGHQWAFVKTAGSGMNVDFEVDFLHVGIGFALGL